MDLVFLDNLLILKLNNKNMNLNKALKLKKKLVKQCNDYFTKFQSNNSFEITQQTPDYDPQVMYKKWLESVEELIALKTKIHIANQPITGKIFRMGELKSCIQNLKRVDTKHGKQRISPYGTEMCEYDSYLKKVEIDTIISNWENDIEQIQEEIEAFNAITKI